VSDEPKPTLSRRVAAWLYHVLATEPDAAGATGPTPPHAARSNVVPAAHERVVEKPEVRCLHFNGTMHGACKAGVPYGSVEMRYEPFRPGPNGFLPCIRGDGIAWRCPHVAYPSEAEVARMTVEREEMLRRASEEFDRDLAAMVAGRCPHCGAVMTKRHVGRSVYADPCGHRLYQGDA
jgi:hypothetical protein